MAALTICSLIIFAQNYVLCQGYTLIKLLIISTLQKFITMNPQLNKENNPMEASSERLSTKPYLLNKSKIHLLKNKFTNSLQQQEKFPQSMQDNISNRVHLSCIQAENNNNQLRKQDENQLNSKQSKHNSKYIRKTVKIVRKVQTLQNERTKKELDIQSYLKQLQQMTLPTKNIPKKQKQQSKDRLRFRSPSTQKFIQLYKKQQTMNKQPQIVKNTDRRTISRRMTQRRTAFISNKTLLMHPEDKKIQECFKIIDKILHVVQQIQQLGYKKKVDRMLVTYCVNNRFWLIEVFLIQSKLEKFSAYLKYTFIKSAQTIKVNLFNFIFSANYRGIDVIYADLNDFYEYVEAVLTQKNHHQLISITTNIENKFKENAMQKEIHIQIKQPYFNPALRFQQNQIQKFHFMQDLRRTEDKFGQMQHISKVSRRRFQDLNSTYIKLRTLEEQ